ncbi:Beta-propeller repeat-containing protein [Methylomagnum ishizawai]|uniref:Beta-propeller repeat-containing protein n=1 Tax=Methylomagnum ishizawai TaxID=1760988 RepID=A0A1Y6D3M8_9GAMM|nr:SBBP repeat-containing protein [Methylomagnum ishizawai]SMF97201.1 Beta-propeller repeat-containing protein [Methylomagnum ishizawai]
MNNHNVYKFLCAAFFALAFADTCAAAPPLITVDYTRHYGSPLDEQLTGIAHDALGNALVVGNSVDSSSGGTNGFVRKYDGLGALLWHQGKDSASMDGITMDKNGHAYIVGSYTAGTWPNERDYIYLQSLDSTGTTLWTKQFTVPVVSDRTRLTANAIATDPRGKNAIVILFEKAYYPYQNRQVFIRKYNVSGGLLWEKQVNDISSPYAARPSLAIDPNGNIYVAANSVSFQKWNTSLTRLDAQGIATWTVPFFPTSSTQLTYVHALAADKGGNVYLTGITRGNLVDQNQGYDDVFLRKYGSDGSILWTKQFGTDSDDYGNDLTVDSVGNIYVVGSSMGKLNGTNQGSYDAFVRKYNMDGQLLRGRQFGTSDFDIANAVCVDDNNAVYVGGNTNGNLGGAAKGKLDIYLRKYKIFQ